MSRRVDVERVLQALGIDVKKKGRLHWASCPTPGHNDSDASWRIILDEDSDRYGQHRCYGCKFGGYAIHLVCAVHGLDYQDHEQRHQAQEWLDSFESDERLPLRVELKAPELRRATGQFELPDGVELGLPLEQWARRPRAYAEERGITAQQVQRWGIGYARTGYLAGRIVMPVHDATGRLVSYTGRAYNGASLRYRNARLEDGADLAAVFGEQHWGSLDRCILVEGALNGLACERVAPTWAIAALYGSNVVAKHVLKLSRFKRIVLASDPDAAGDRVADTLANQLARYAHVTRLQLPGGMDCADLAPAVLGGMLEAEGL